MGNRILALTMLTTFLTVPMATFALTTGDLSGQQGGNVTGLGTDYINAKIDAGAGKVGQFDWWNFNLGANQTYNTEFTGHSQTALNRVLGNNMSEIYGKMTSTCGGGSCGYDGTGKVILINPNGILFGAGSQVNLSSFTASTADAVGAKNVITGSDVYGGTLDATFGPNVNISFSNTASKIQQILDKGNSASINLDGATFNIDKTLVLMGKDVDINNSKITTNKEFNYTPDQSLSNVKIIAGSGADITYRVTGYVRNDALTPNSNLNGTAITNNVTVRGGSEIESGNIYVKNAGNGDVDIKGNSTLTAWKLNNFQEGSITVEGNRDINIAGSTLITKNTHKDSNKDINTHSNRGGDITITAGRNVDLTSSTIQSAYSGATAFSGDEIGPGGDIKITAVTGNVTGDNATVFARGNNTIDAAKKVSFTNSTLVAQNMGAYQAIGSSKDGQAIDINKNLTITAGDDVELKNTQLLAKNNTVTSKNGSINMDGSKILNNNYAKAEDVKTTLTAKGNITSTGLEVNGTKLVAKAGNDVNLKLSSATNRNAGINVEGKNVTISATDDVLSISRIVSNRLTLDENDKLLAASDELADTTGLGSVAADSNPTDTNGANRAYIEVKEYGGFNLDKTTASIDSDGNYQGFYTASYVPGNFKDDTNNSVDGYTKHFINTDGEKFLLVYNKKSDYCAPPPVDDTDYSTPVAYEDNGYLVRLPIQSVFPGPRGPITNNLADTSSNMLAAAAGITLDGEENADTDELREIYTVEE